MKAVRSLIIGSALALSLAGCANFQASSEKFRADLATLQGDVVAVNNAIASINSSLAKNCSTLESTAQAVASLTGVFTQNTTAKGALAAANAALATYCDNPPSDITSAIKATAAEIVAAKAAYKAAKNGG